MITQQSKAQTGNLIQRYPIVAFFILAYTFSWVIGGLMLAQANGLADVPVAIYYLYAFGPALSAIIITTIVDGRAGLSDLWARIWRTNVRMRWWLIGIGTPIVFGVMVIVFYWATNGTFPDLNAFGEVDYLGDIGILVALLVWIATYGFGEEIGWRGFAFHRLYPQHGLIKSAVVIGLLWGFWHIPFFFFKPNFMALGAGGFVMYVVSVTFGSIVLSWLYHNSRSSILIVALWHALFDFVSASAIADGGGNMLISIIIVLWAIYIIRSASQPQLE